MVDDGVRSVHGTWVACGVSVLTNDVWVFLLGAISDSRAVGLQGYRQRRVKMQKQKKERLGFGNLLYVA